MLKPSIELLVASIFWGYGFVATVWCLESSSPVTLTFLRFLVAGIAGVTGVLLVRAWSLRAQIHLGRSSGDFSGGVSGHISEKHSGESSGQLLHKNSFHFFGFSSGLRMLFADFPKEAKLAIWPGFFICGTLLFQTFGLAKSTPTLAAFLTTLYVVIIPILMWIWKGMKPKFLHVLAVALAIVGTMMLTKIQNFDFGLGEILLLVNAFFAAFHIISMDRISTETRNAFLCNSLQCLWCAGGSGLCLIVGLEPFSISHSAWSDVSFLLNLASLALGSSLLSFFLQIRAQRSLSPAVASMAFLAEAPFSAFFSVWLLSEKLTPSQYLGAFVILGAAVFSIRGNLSKSSTAH